jgi:hypothetical protein
VAFLFVFPELKRALDLHEEPCLIEYLVYCLLLKYFSHQSGWVFILMHKFLGLIFKDLQIPDNFLS